MDLESLRKLNSEIFAPMIQQMQIDPIEITETGVRFHVPTTDFVMRTGDIVCGQAIAGIADSVGVMALFVHNEEQRIMTTVDMTTHFMRPLSAGTLEFSAIILSNGRRMANVRVEARQSASSKIAATSTCAYVYV